MKKWIMTLVAVLLLMLTGCNLVLPGSTTETKTEPVPETSLVRPMEPKEDTATELTEPEKPPVFQIQYLPKEVGDAEDVPVLKWVCLVDSLYGGKDRVWNEAAVHELNDMLMNLEMGLQLQFVVVTADRFLYKYDWLSNPQIQEVVADADLIYGNMSSDAMQQYLTPITQYTKGSNAMLRNAVPHRAYWCAANVNGEIYGIPTRNLQASTTGWVVDESFLVELSLSEEDFEKNFWEMDALFEAIAANRGGAFLYMDTDDVIADAKGTPGRGIYPNSLYSVLGPVHKIGSCYAIDYSKDMPYVVNYLELDQVRKFQEAAIRYKKAGYVTSEYSDGMIKYTGMNSNTVYSKWGNLYIPVTEPIFAYPAENEYVTGIAAASNHKKEAVSLLTLIANYEDFRMQLFFGREGRDYTVENGYYKLLKQEDGSNYSLDFLSPLAYFCGLTADRMTYWGNAPSTENWDMPGETGEEKLKYLRDTMDDSTIALPIIFDYAGYENELEDIDWICRRYFPIMTNTVDYSQYERPEMTPALYDLMLEDLRDKGSDSLRWELQEQLDEWLKENPDWQ